MFSRRFGKQARRGAVRKSEQHANRAMLVKLVAIVLSLAAIATASWQLRNYQPDTFMPIEHVAIEGSFENLSTDDMRARVLEVLQGGYFTVDLQAIRDALLQLPWVEEVSVRRQWPSALNIGVSEKRAVAYWGEDSLISDKGEVFTPAHRMQGVSMPQLNGPAGLHKKVWQFAAEVSAQLVNLGMSTEKVVLDERRAWRVYVAMNADATQQEASLIEINLGREDTVQRLKRFLTVFAMRNAPSLENIQVVDMRYPNGFALRSNATREKDA